MTWSILKLWFKLLDGIKNEIKAINCGKQNNYGKDPMNIKLSVWVIKMLQYKKLMFQKELTLIKQVHLKGMYALSLLAFWRCCD